MKKSKENIFFILPFFLFIFLLLYFLTFPSKLQEDSLWNFQSIFKMANYGAIYTVNNVIHTPLFFELGNIFFKVLGSNFLTYSILQLLLFFSEFILFYIIFRNLNINSWNSMLYTQILFLLIYNYLGTDASYHILSVIFTLVGIIVYFRQYNTKKYHYLQGLIIFFTFFTKQTIGVYYAIGIVVFELINIGIQKEFFINQIKKLCGFLPPLVISLIIMYFRGNLFNFINLCFGSLFEFGTSNLFFVSNCVPYVIFIVQILLFSFILIFKMKKITEEQKKNMIFLLCLSIFLSFNMLPLINKYHTLISCTYYFILFLYELDFAIFSELFSEKYIKKIIIVLFVLLSFKVTFDYFEYNKDLDTFPKNSYFYPAKMSSESIDKINILTQYIENKKENNIDVIMLSYDAGLYMISLKINNYEFDMLLSGNLGYNGIQNTIDKISNMKNTEFLIFTDENDCYWQEPKDIREYIINNFEKSGEIFNYSIYLNN